MRSIAIFFACIIGTASTLAEISLYNYNKVEYPLPEVPDSIKLPKERADYATAHFWDSYSADSIYAVDNSAMEQALTNFAAIAKMGSHGDGETGAINRLVELSAANNKAANVLASVAELCLYEAESPVYDKLLYEKFADAFSATPSLPAWITYKYNIHKRLMQLNAPGSKATDFAIDLLDGTKTSLYEQIGNPYTVLILYDPSCEHCDAIIEKFAAEPIVDKWINAGITRILAVDFILNNDSDAKAESLPASWTVGFDNSDIEKNDLYFIPTTPSFYLLDNEGTVLMKDADALDVLETIWEQTR